jgi:hypothetical protein
MTARKTKSPKRLAEDEKKRIDELLTEARRYHLSAVIVAGISIALSSLDQTTGIELPIGKINLPSTQTAVGLYFLVILLSMAANRLFDMAEPWMHLDTRRPPFPWVALGTPPYSFLRFSLWLLIPIFVAALATAFTLQSKDTSGVVLSFVGVVLFFLPLTFARYSTLISKKEDARGGRATLSIYLLYYYRLLRQVAFFGIFVLPIFAIVPKWRMDMTRAAGYLVIFSASIFVIRTIGGFRFVYKAIDRFGARIGFPTESKHYK